MTRPTALIRHLLVLESLQEYITQEITLVKEQMRNEDVKIIDRKTNLQEIRINYKCGTTIDDTIYMRKMLYAESKNRVKRIGMMT